MSSNSIIGKIGFVLGYIVGAGAMAMFGIILGLSYYYFPASRPDLAMAVALIALYFSLRKSGHKKE